MNLLDYARAYTNANLAVIPIRFKDKRPATSVLPNGTWHEYQTKLPTDTELQRWFSTKLRNIAIVVGWNNLVVLDFDNLVTYNKWLLWIARRGGWAEIVAERTYQVKTARGVHVYVHTKEKELNRKLDGIDIKAQGGYVLAPPSVHPSGLVYAAVKENAKIMDIDVLSDIIPAELLIDSARNTEFQNPGIAAILAKRDVVCNDPWESVEDVPDPSRDMIRQVRERNNILDWFPDASRTSKDGRWWRAKCPFHADSNPSFWIDVQRGICGCFSGCTAKPLDVINLYARLYGCSDREAIFGMINRWS